MQQLKKLSDDHYVVVTDEPINFNDYYLSCLSNRVLQRTEKMDIVEVNDKKITHSTQPLEEYTYEESGEGVFDKDFFNIKPLDLSYIKSLVGEKESKPDNIPQEIKDLFYFDGKSLYGQALMMWQIGYNQCLEYNKHKRFSEEDLKKAFKEGYYGRNFIGFDDFISFLTQPKDTWEVYFDTNNNLKLK